MSRSRRILLILLLIVVIGLTAFQVARLYLARHAANAVASHLEESYGADVHVGAVQIGVHKSTVQDLQFFEANGSDQRAPWASVGEAEADVSLAGLLHGEFMPRELTLHGADVTLRFDKAGHLLTRIPRPKGGAAALPEIRIENSKLTIEQEGRPTFVIDGIALDVTHEPGAFAATGTVVDPTWNHWTVAAHFDPTNVAGSATLKTERCHVTQEMLNSLPFVPESVWREVQCTGDTSADVHFETIPNERGVHYKISLQPVQTAVFIPSIGLSATDAHGKVSIDNGFVQLRDVEGHTAGGDLKVSGDLDFRGAASQLNFQVRVTDLDVRKLPQRWSLPSQVEGRLSGQAKLHVTVSAGHATTSGTGDGVIQDARIAGQPASPIQLKLNASGSGFRFSTAVARPRADLLASLSLPRRETYRLALAPENPQPPEGETLDVELAMKNADIATLLQRFGIKTAVPITGRVTFDMKIALPVNAPRDFKSYRAEGTASAARLRVAGVDLRQVSVQLRYDAGVLEVRKISGQVPRRRSLLGPGSFTGEMRAEIVPPGMAKAHLVLEKAPISQLLGPLVSSSWLIRGGVSGTVDAEIPVAQLHDPRAWRAAALLNAADVRAYGVSLRAATAVIALKDGTATVTRLNAQAQGVPVTASAEARLVDELAFHAKVSAGPGELAALLRAPILPRLPASGSGRISANATLQGTLRPFAWTATGSAAASNLRVAKIHVAAARLVWNADPARLRISEIAAQLYGGTITGQATVPLETGAVAPIALGFQRVDLGAIARDARLLPFPIAVTADGRVTGTLTTPSKGSLPQFNGELALTAPRLVVREVPAEKLTGNVVFRPEALDYRLQGQILGGAFQVDGRTPRGQTAQTRGDGRFTLRGALLSRFAPAFGLGDRLAPLRGRVDADVTYALDPDGTPVGQGSVRVGTLRWGDVGLAPHMRADLELTRTEVRVQRFAAPLGGGSVHGHLVVVLRGGQRGWFDLTIRHVDASRLLAPWPQIGGRTIGALDGAVRGQLNSEWTGSGELVLSTGAVQGIAVSGLRIPLTFSWQPGGYGRIDISDTTAQVAAGRFDGDARYEWGDGNRLRARLRFTRFDLQSVLRDAAVLAYVPSARISARVTLAGDSMQSLADLTGSIDGTLGETQAFEFPVFRQILPFLSPGLSPSMTFESGRLRGSLGRGSLRVEELSLAGQSVRMFSSGNVQLDGSLSLDVVASTGRLGLGPIALRTVDVQGPVSGTLPAGLAAQVGNELTNRVIRVHVGGNIHNPSVHFEPGIVLTQEAIIFFLSRANVPLP